MKKVYVYMMILLVSVGFVACSDKVEEQPSEHHIQAPLTFDKDEDIHSLMSKILSFYAPKRESLESLLPPSEQKHKFMPVEQQKDEITNVLWSAYEQNEANKFEVPMLEKALILMQEWNLLYASAKPYMQIPLLEQYDTQISLSLALLLLNNEKGDSVQLSELLDWQYQSAKQSGELNKIIESQIQVRLLALHGLHHLNFVNQSTSHLASHRVRLGLEQELDDYKDFLPIEHYEVYQKALTLLKAEILTHQAPIDKIFMKLVQYHQRFDTSLADSDDVHLHLERISNAYELLKAHNIRSTEAQDIILVAQNPLKNMYNDTLMANYLYGLDYLTLAFLGSNTQENLPLALQYLQQDFQYFQITEHRFDASLYQNYLASIVLGAYILSSLYENEAYFNELLRTAKSELAYYRDVMSHDDIETYEDAIFILDQVDRSKFLQISIEDSKPKDEIGYAKVPLILSPQEIAQLNAIAQKEQVGKKEGKAVMLTPLEVKFMLSLTYQAYKAQGFRGVAPEMFKIRLGEVFDIETFNKSPLVRHLIDFDVFMLLGVADRQCYVQNEHINTILGELERKQDIYGYNVFFDKENGFITDKILPSQVIERTTDGNVYYRLLMADLYLNSFIFHNDESAFVKFRDSVYLGELLPTLLAFFPYIKEYLENRISPKDTDEILSRLKPKSCDN